MFQLRVEANHYSICFYGNITWLLSITLPLLQKDENLLHLRRERSNTQLRSHHVHISEIMFMFFSFLFFLFSLLSLLPVFYKTTSWKRPITHVKNYAWKIIKFSLRAEKSKNKNKNKNKQTNKKQFIIDRYQHMSNEIFCDCNQW